MEISEIKFGKAGIYREKDLLNMNLSLQYFFIPNNGSYEELQGIRPTKKNLLRMDSNPLRYDSPVLYDSEEGKIYEWAIRRGSFGFGGKRVYHEVIEIWEREG